MDGVAWQDVEPVIRASLLRLLPDDAWPGTEAVGGWWNRSNSPEVDLVGADREPTVESVYFVGPIEWLENHSIGRHEYETLVRDESAVPGADQDTPTVAVSRRGVTDDLPPATHRGPEALVNARENAPQTAE